VVSVKTNTTNAALVSEFPKEYLSIMNHLRSLTFASEPDYGLLLTLLKKALQDIGLNENVPFDWERKVFLLYLFSEIYYLAKTK
jgi:hypothetical protein